MDKDAVTAIATLDDDVRSALYAVVRDADAPVTREHAADAVGISRKLAAFHLDKLVAAGLLDTAGPAAPKRVGRAPKRYRLAADHVELHLPPRAPGTLAEILAAGIVTARDGESAREAVLRVARERGAALGARFRPRRQPTSPARVVGAATAMLAEGGYLPCVRENTVHLRNCPFHSLAATEPELVCGLNHALITGALEAMATGEQLEAVLAPQPGMCCVQVRPR